jgi:hypothetical protein
VLVSQSQMDYVILRIRSTRRLTLNALGERAPEPGAPFDFSVERATLSLSTPPAEKDAHPDQWTCHKSSDVAEEG